MAVVHGPEVASSGTRNGGLSIQLLVSMVRSLERYKYDVTIVVDEELRDAMARTEISSRCLERAVTREAPSGSEIGPFVLAVADEIGATVVSNERFEDYQSQYPWITDRRIPYRVYRGKVYLDPISLMGVF